MERPPLSPWMLVADLLALSPLTARTLLDLRVDCVGCSMTRFCTLEEMCRFYGLKLDAVIEKLSQPLEDTDRQ
jgi:hybrid cluster-associated redox disulfide protein